MNFYQKTVAAITLAVVGMTVVIISGCCPFNDARTMPQDSMEDQSNMPYVAVAQQQYEARTQFRRQVVIKPSNKAQLFLGNQVSPNFSVPFKRELLQLFEQALIEEISKLRDFQIAASESASTVDSGATITGTGENQDSRPYRLEFHINSISFSAPLGGSLEIAGSFTNGNHATKEALQKNKIWVANAQVVVTLLAPDGTPKFTFSKTVTLPSLPSPQPDNSLFLNVVKLAASQVMDSYNRQFGPPMYVQQTIGGGHFVQLSAGSEYGIKAGQKIKFYRNQKRTLPTLGDQAPKVRIEEIPVGSGVAGKGGAPIDTNSAWVHVDGCQKKEQTVLLWTSAKVVE